MQLYDISAQLGPGTPVFPGDPPVELAPVSRADGGRSFGVSRLSLSTHAGTHVDPPAHLIPGGLTIDQLPLTTLVGLCRVIDVGARRIITAAFLEGLGLEAGIARLLFKTANSALWDIPGVQSDNVHLDATAAEWLAQRGVALVGIDYLSVDALTSAELPAHHTLLSAGAVLLEGLDLRAVAAGEYQLACLPLKLRGGDGAPARAVLMR